MIQALSRLGRRAGRAASQALDADRAVVAAGRATVELAAARYALDPGAQWRPGEPLRLLLVGYAGSRNTGADARVEEMVRHFRYLVGDEHLALSITTIDPAKYKKSRLGLLDLRVRPSGSARAHAPCGVLMFMQCIVRCLFCCACELGVPASRLAMVRPLDDPDGDEGLGHWTARCEFSADVST